MKIICIGQNYLDHIKELNSKVPTEPVFFMKPDTAYLPAGNDFYIPDFTRDLHYECEIVVKIKKVGKNIQEKFAPGYYDEISLGIDFTARDLQEQCKAKSLPWEKAKAFDNSAPMGTHFIPVSSLDLKDLHFTLKKNGTAVQNGHSADMLEI